MEVNQVSQLDITSEGSPWCHMISFKNKCAKPSALLIIFEGMKWALFINQLIKTIIASKFLGIWGRCIIKSIEIDVHHPIGIGKDCKSFIVFWLTDLFYWYVS